MDNTVAIDAVTPQIRFHEFDQDWQIVALRDITKYTKGFAFKSSDFGATGTRVIRVSDLGASSVKSNGDKVYVNDSSVEKFDRYLLRKGNIIITTVGSKPELVESAVGRGVFIVNENEGLLNQNLLKFENITEVENGFIFGLLQSSKYRQHIKEIARGNANQANITVEDLLKFKIHIPSLPEQQKIAFFLSAVDEKIQLLKRKKGLLEQYKKGVMQQLFSGKVRFKDENGEDYPDWEEKKLMEVAARVSEKNKKNEVNFVLTNSATEGIVSQGLYFDREIANQNNLQGYYVVAIDDFVYNPRISVNAPVGPIKRNKLRQGVMSPLYSVFRFNEECLDFFEYFFETSIWHDYLKGVANSGARHDRMNISNSNFFEMPIPMPSLAEREKIASFLSVIDQKVRYTNSQLALTQTFKKGLLQQMFV